MSIDYSFPLSFYWTEPPALTHRPMGFPAYHKLVATEQVVWTSHQSCTQNSIQMHTSDTSKRQQYDSKELQRTFSSLSLKPFSVELLCTHRKRRKWLCEDWKRARERRSDPAYFYSYLGGGGFRCCSTIWHAPLLKHTDPFTYITLAGKYSSSI